MSWTVIADGKRPCITCREIKSVTEFYSYPYKTAQGKQSVRNESRCISCARSRRRAARAANIDVELVKNRERHARNRDLLNLRTRTYRAANVDKVRRQRVCYEQRRRAGVLMSQIENAEMLGRVLGEARFGDLYLDAYSGALIASPTIDHIVPLSRGGKHQYDNLCVTSRPNNSSKAARPLIVWLSQRETRPNV